MVKKLSKKDMKDYRLLLAGKRREATGNFESGSLTGENSKHGHVNPAAGDSADQGSGAFEQDFALSILENEANVVQKIDKALARIDTGVFGVCTKCSKPITKARLKAIPWVQLCIDCQREEEAV